MTVNLKLQIKIGYKNIFLNFYYKPYIVVLRLGKTFPPGTLRGYLSQKRDGRVGACEGLYNSAKLRKKTFLYKNNAVISFVRQGFLYDL